MMNKISISFVMLMLPQFTQFISSMDIRTVLPKPVWVEIAKFAILSKATNESANDCIKQYCSLRSVSKFFKDIADDKQISVALNKYISEEVLWQGIYYNNPLLGHIFGAVELNKVSFFYFLLKKDPTMLNKIVDDCGTTLLHWAAPRSEKVTKFLLAQPGININATDVYKKTPLYYVTNENENTKKLLIDAGAIRLSKKIE